jgi:hypothetical protein
MTRDPALSPSVVRQAETQTRVAKALTLMREGHSATVAAHKAGTTLRTMRRYAGKALKPTPSRRYQVAAGDRLRRYVRMLTPVGLIAIEARTSKAASEIARYWAAVHRYLKTGDDGPLQVYRGKRIRVGRVSYPFVTDLPTLERLAHAGEVQFEDLYEVRI